MSIRKNTPMISGRPLAEAAAEAGVGYSTAYVRLKKGLPEALVLAKPAAPIKDTFDDCYIPEPNSGCWLWLRGQNGEGYGTFHLKGGQSILAHRYAYGRVYGFLPPRLHVLHRCDNPICVNPDHLFVGTATDNLQDMAKKGRAAGQKLTAAQALAIRKDKRGLKEIAKEHDVTISLVSKIRLRKTWAHLE